MRKASAKWRQHGLELDFTDLGFEGERNDVASHLENFGWRSVGTPMRQLLADNGLAAIAAERRLRIGGRHRLLQLRTGQLTQGQPLRAAPDGSSELSFRVISRSASGR